MNSDRSRDSVLFVCVLIIAGLAFSQTRLASNSSQSPDGGPLDFGIVLAHPKLESEVPAEMNGAALQERVQIQVDAPRLKSITFSPGVKVGKLLFISGQISIDPVGNIVGRGDFEAQCNQVFSNIKLVLDRAGASFSDVVKINAYLTDMRNYPVYARVRGQYFSDLYPASSVIGVNELIYEGVMLEVEAIAVLK